MNLRHTGAGLAAALLVVAVPLSAQTTDAGTTGTAPPRDPQTKPTVTPEQVIGVVRGLIKPKPSPTIFPTPTPAPTLIPTPTPASAISPTPTPRPVPTLQPTVTVPPTPAPRPTVAAPAPVASASATPTGLEAANEPLPEASTMGAQPVVDELSGPPPPRQLLPWWILPWWLWLIAGAAAGGLAELARRWFWPKLKLGCEIATGPSALTAASSPAVTTPDVTFDIRIESGEASAPAGHPILAEGGIA